MSDLRLGPAPSGRVPSLVSVIVPVRNGAATLAEQIDALRGQDHDGPWELVLADNGSTDATIDVFERAVVPGSARPGSARATSDPAAAGRGAGPWVDARVVDASQRAGSAHARNVGAADARGDLLCFCDADDVVEPAWLRELVRVAADHHLVGGRLDTDALNTDRVRGWRPAPSGEVARAPRFAPSGNLAIWSDVFAALGGLDVTFLKSHDVELSKRALGAGASLGFAPGAVVRYRLRSTLRGLAHQAYRSGRASVQMATRFPDREAPMTARHVVARAAWSVTRLPYLAFGDRRGVWVRRTAEMTGVAVALAKRSLRRRFR